MKELLGYFLIAQAILTAVIAYSLAQISDSIKASGAHIVSRDVQLSWGSQFGMTTVALLLIILVAGIGVFLIVKKNN
jgi:hypothetical protein